MDFIIIHLYLVQTALNMTSYLEKQEIILLGLLCGRDDYLDW